MPQLLSRRDNTGWLTPSMADILTQAPAPLPGEETLRTQMTELQQKLADNDSPIRVVDVRPSPSHTLFVARPEVVGRLGSRRQVSPNEIRRGLAALAEQQKDWQLGFINRLQADDENVGILLRTPQHQPLQLRQLLISNAYTSRPSTLSLVLGVGLQQQALIRELDKLEHLIIIGPENTRRHLINEVLLTLLMLNTPSELRLALMGESIKQADSIAQMPHTLGRLITTPENGLRLLDGMVKELERRRQWFLEQSVETLRDYNQLLENRDEPPLAHILIFFDSLSDAPWQAESERWMPALYDLLVNGPRLGVHLLLTASQPADLPEPIESGSRTQIVMRSANPELIERLPSLHSSALRFVDAFVISKEAGQKNAEITPVELCTVTGDDMQRLIAYWRQMSIQRAQSTSEHQTRGVTGILAELETRPPTPPTGQTAARPVTAALARATYALSGDADERRLQQAQALAAYLGWLGISPLRDVLGLSAAEARATLAVLQRAQVIEDGDTPVLRFLRLAENPLAEGEERDAAAP
jgi:hypothetical protein